MMTIAASSPSTVAIRAKTSSVRVEDERGNPVTLFELKAMAEQEGREDAAKP
jgi:hypothetical protein